MMKLKDKEMEVIRIEADKGSPPLLAFKTNGGEVGVILEDKEDRYFDKEDVVSAVGWLKEQVGELGGVCLNDEMIKEVNKKVDEAFEGCS